jgi:hypothetical protein
VTIIHPKSRAEWRKWLAAASYRVRAVELDGQRSQGALQAGLLRLQALPQDFAEGLDLPQLPPGAPSPRANPGESP